MSSSAKSVLTRCALTPTQEKEWETTRAAMLWHTPAFTHILYNMMNNAGSKHIALFTKDIPIAATDGDTLILNPDTFFARNLQQRVFITAHEIMHCVLHHCSSMYDYLKRGGISYADGTKLDYDQETANIAMDLVINDLLIETKVGEFPGDGMHDRSLGTSQDSWIDVYKKVYKNNPGGNPGGNGGKGGFDVHLQPGSSKGQDPTSASNARNPAAWGAAVKAAAAVAKAQGKLHAGLERVFGEAMDPKVDWKDRIRSLIMRRTGSDAYDWRKPDRRLISRKNDPIYAPARSGFGAGAVVVGVDSSGSCIGEQDMFLSEIAGILEDVKPSQLYIMWCDAYVHRVDECDEPDDLNRIRAAGSPGGGGTSFVPVFDEIEKMGIRPDALIYLTDGVGTFPAQAPDYPVIWGDVYGTKYPFGDVVEIPKQAA